MNFTYVIHDEKEPYIELTGCLHAERVLRLPAYVDGVSVQMIAPHAFERLPNVEEIIPQAVSVTGIKNVKVVSDPNASIKVYTIDGRYVGDSIQGLAKGVYVVGGRKMVIK